MNYIELLTLSTFYEYLLKFDEDISRKTQENGCFFCGGRLYRSNWTRKGYGLPDFLRVELRVRHSFTCACCKKRSTPNSLRFMYYRWYACGVEVVALALEFENDEAGLTKLMELAGITKETLLMLKKWWAEFYASSEFLKRLPPTATSADTPSWPKNILSRFEKAFGNNLKKVLINSTGFLSAYRTNRLWQKFLERTSAFKPPGNPCSPFFMG